MGFGWRAALSGWIVVLASLACAAVRAQVTEPNGLSVPQPGPSFEPSLQSYFDGRMPPEAIDAVGDASPEPAVFSPLCGFQAELVLSASSASAGLAWYNVPADPNAPPSALYQILKETTQAGAILSSADIRDDPNYMGGLVGFALMKNGQAIYYSEAERNKLCSACSMPGHWKMMLAYASKADSTTYYLAWEDWEGANESNWPNDGDFNDKVFRLNGVRCAGGGEPCDTGQKGVCGPGLTACQAKGTPVCQPLMAAEPERCDAVDNDCNGNVDDGARCDPGKLCVRGTCVWACGGEEFPCLDDTACDEGLCVEPACVGVRCEAGKTCRAGACVAPCEGVRCPLGQECRASRCVDPCEGVKCKDGGVCERGVCVGACSCSGCPAAKSCDAGSGRCVEPGCAGKSCKDGEVCAAGACVDACRDAMCPFGAACKRGRCEDSGPRGMVSEVPPATSPEAPMTLPIPETAGRAAAANGGTGGGGGSSTVRPSAAAESGCGCRAAGSGEMPRALWLAASVAVLACLRRRRRTSRAG